MSLFLFAFQVLSAAQPANGIDDFDLSKVGVGNASCKEGPSGDDVVVCGRKKAMDVIIVHPVDYSEKPVRAGVALPGGGAVDVHVEEHQLPGARSTAAMVTLKLPF